MRRYQVTIADQSFRESGLSHWTSTGTACEVQGDQCVRLANGVIVPATAWHETRAEAMRAAAHRIQTLGELLLLQAANMRRDADKEVQ